MSDIAKRGLDLFAATILLLVLSPLLLILAMLVRLSSPGPALFRQQRVGKDGRLFWMYKFRSMYDPSARRRNFRFSIFNFRFERDDNPKSKIQNPKSIGPSVTAGGDARITPLGRRLRQWKLDELPQLLNVLRGDMSLVGPRPEVPEYVRHYTEEQRQVLSVRPGITGVCQLEFRHEEALLAGRTDVEEFYLREILPTKLALDLRYVRERTFLGDLRLLFRTVTAILRREPDVPRTSVKG